MKNCIILGFGRSGTSLMGGILYHSGYFMGDDLYPSRESNPKGFFENDFINGINERILSNYDFTKLHGSQGAPEYASSPYNPLYGQRWLSYIEPETAVTHTDNFIVADIEKALAVSAFAYKDPRFNFTLPVWKRYLPDDVVYICMFRQPEITVESVLKDCQTADYLADFHIDRETVFKLWYNSYQRVLQNLSKDPNQRLIFVHYEQLLSKEILPELSKTLDANLDSGFISPELNRSQATSYAPRYILDLYETLCSLSQITYQRG